MSRLQLALCGSIGPDEELNPYRVCAAPERQEILCLINVSPLTQDEIAARLRLPEEEVGRHLAALARAGLAEEREGRCKPTFAIFTMQDQEWLGPLIAKMANTFAKVVQENMDLVRNAYEACRFSKHGFSFTHLAYILIGAYTLDYGGLALEEEGLLVAAKEMPGGAYVLAGFEGELVDLRGSWMWGHSSRYGPVTFFSHGELPAKRGRQAFPDLAWRWPDEGWRKERINRVMEELGAILVALYEVPMNVGALAERMGLDREELAEHLALLEKLGYVEKRIEEWASLCPVVDDGAEAQIQRMVQEMWAKLLRQAIRPNWETLTRLYEATSPAGNGIDIREAFNPIHHAIFEQALRLLMEQGTIPWPKRRADGARYVVWAQERGR